MTQNPIVEIIQTRFDDGITSDPRDTRSNVSQVIGNFDIVANAHRAVPYRSSESGDASASTSQKQNFAIALRTGTTYDLFALGVKSGAATAEVLRKSISTGGSNDLSDATWATPSNNQSSTGATFFDLFTYYKTTGKIYGAAGTGKIWSFDPTGGAWSDTERDLTSITNICNGVVHPADDHLYIPHDTKIEINNAGSWSQATAVFPSSLYPTSACAFNNYLAIATAPLSGFGRSTMFIWDRDSSNATFLENIDWGDGLLKICEQLDGELIGVSLVANSATLQDRVVFQKYVPGIGAQKIMEIQGTTGTLLPKYKQKVKNRLYFQMSININGTRRDGIWSFGKSTFTNQWTLILERTPNNDTALATSYNLTGFIVVGDYVFQSYQSASTYALSKTNDQVSYTATSYIETLKKVFDKSGTRRHKWKIVSANVLHEPLTSGQSVTLKVRKDSDSSYATILTSSTVGDITPKSATKMLDASVLPEGKEFDFRIESAGGAVVLGFDAKGEMTGKDSTT